MEHYCPAVHEANVSGRPIEILKWVYRAYSTRVHAYCVVYSSLELTSLAYSNVNSMPCADDDISSAQTRTVDPKIRSEIGLRLCWTRMALEAVSTKECPLYIDAYVFLTSC